MPSKPIISDDIVRQARRHAEFSLTSIQQVSKQYGVSVRTLRRWQATGLMPPRTKHGRRMKYSKGDIALMMAARQKQQS